MLENLSGIRLTLKAGKSGSEPKRVPYEVITALSSVQVTDDAEERDGFQLTFTVGKSQAQDYSLLKRNLFEPKSRVVIVLQIGATLEPLISGVVRHFQLGGSNEPGMATFTVTGEGIITMLHMEEKSKAHANKADSEITRQLLNDAKNASYGFNLKIPKTTEQPDQNRYVPRQYGTDLDHIQLMAKRNGFVFYTEPLPSGQLNVYWGPENRRGKLQPPLTMNMGGETNVTRMSFTQDTRVPFTAKGSRLRSETSGKNDEEIQPPSSESDFDGIVDIDKTETPSADYIVLMRDIAKYTTTRAKQRARELMVPKFGSVTAQGEVDTVRYGYILQAGKLVGVRGAGKLYNGEYYVSQVVHNIESGKYTQSFTLKRDGLGALKDRV